MYFLIFFLIHELFIAKVKYSCTGKRNKLKPKRFSNLVYAPYKTWFTIKAVRQGMVLDRVWTQQTDRKNSWIVTPVKQTSLATITFYVLLRTFSDNKRSIGTYKQLGKAHRLSNSSRETVENKPCLTLCLPLLEPFRQQIYYYLVRYQLSFIHNFC